MKWFAQNSAMYHLSSDHLHALKKVVEAVFANAVPVVKMFYAVFCS